MKKYQVKEKYLKVVASIMDVPSNVSHILIEHGSPTFIKLVSMGVLSEFCDEVKEQWKEPIINIDGELDMYNRGKAHLMLRMQSWADYHNELDGFTPDWSDKNRYKWGIKIEYRKAKTHAFRQSNLFLFQIAVTSERRSDEMLKYFQNDIQSAIDLNVI